MRPWCFFIMNVFLNKRRDTVNKPPLRRIIGPDTSQIIKILEWRIGYFFRNPKLALVAITHSSSVGFGKAAHESNERLEYLGDAVLGLLVRNYLFQTFPQKQEGELTLMSSSIVSERSFAAIARELGLYDVLLASPATRIHIGKNTNPALADLLESIFGAVFLDGGYPQCEALFQKRIIPKLGPFIAVAGNTKGDLQELTIRQLGDTPSYHMVTLRKDDNEEGGAMITVEVKIRERVIGVGTAPIKKEAEKLAAKHALETQTEWLPLLQCAS